MKTISKYQTLSILVLFAKIRVFKAEIGAPLEIPFVEEGIKAGFPSPAQDYVEQSIDLNKLIIKHPSSTFFARVDGNSMENTYIMDGDIAVIDRSLEVYDGCKVVANIDGEYVMKTIKIEKDKVLLIAENPDYPPITVTHDQNLIIWGVVTHVIHKLH